MRHQKSGRKFHRKKGQRKALFKSLLGNLITKEKILTTEAKAKEIRPLLEKLISVAKKKNLASLRILLSRLPKKSAQKLYYEIGPRYKNTRGGYLRITKSLRSRKSDGAKMAIVEFIKE